MLLPLARLAQCNFTLRQHGPSVIITLSHRAPTCAIWCAIGPYQKPFSIDHDSFRGQEEAGHAQQTNELFTCSTTQKLRNPVNKPPQKLLLSTVRGKILEWEKIGEFGESWALRQYFTRQLFLFRIFQLATV